MISIFQANAPELQSESKQEDFVFKHVTFADLLEGAEIVTPLEFNGQAAWDKWYAKKPKPF